MILQAIKTVFSLLFPIITFKYISSALGVSNVGQINFSSSIVSYFSLFAGLGIASYGIREGARIRHDIGATTKLVTELFSINVISMSISYLALILSLIFIPAFKGYEIVILIISSGILFTTIGVDWVNIIYEDFFFLTIRYIIIQILSFLLMVIFVKDSTDVIIYAILMTIAGYAANVANFVHIFKRIRFGFHISPDMKKHIKPILLIFASSLSIAIYVNSDMTMLGLMVGDKAVGIYASATKVYTSVKAVIAAVIIVILPRISSIAGKNSTQFNEALNDILSFMMLITLPCVIGLSSISKRVILTVASEAYVEASGSLSVLSIAILFSIVASIFTMVVFLPLRKEKITLIVTLLSALLNILLNLFFIPIWGHLGAAITTLLSEAFICILCLVSSKNVIKVESDSVKRLFKEILEYTLISVIIGVFAYNISNAWPIHIVYTIFIILLCASGYILMLLGFKNRFAINAVSSALSYLRR